MEPAETRDELIAEVRALRKRGTWMLTALLIVVLMLTPFFFQQCALLQAQWEMAKAQYEASPEGQRNRDAKEAERLIREHYKETH